MIQAQVVTAALEGALADVPDSILIHGTLDVFSIDPSKVDRTQVIDWLNQLDDAFMDNAGGGMSLMNMVETKDHELWGEQYHADQLYVLAAALGLAAYSLPRPVWPALPGGMPYITIFRSKF